MIEKKDFEALNTDGVLQNSPPNDAKLNGRKKEKKQKRMKVKKFHHLASMYL